MASVVFENASRVYPGTTKPAVDKLNLTIKDGEFLVLVGPSGCGKSTSLRMLAGLEEVDTGSIRIGDKDVTHVAPKDRDIAMVFQSYALFPHMRVFENIRYGLEVGQLSAAEINERVSSIMRITGLEALGDRYPHELSGGQQQILAVAQGVIGEPKLLILDEPSSGLAPMVIDRILDVATQLCSQGLAILLVEQLVDKALRHAHYGYLMQTGRIVASAFSEELREGDLLHRVYLGGDNREHA